MSKRSKRLVGEHFRKDGSPKRRFPTRDAAEKYADTYGYNQNLMIYHCQFCDGWHYATRRGRT